MFVTLIITALISYAYRPMFNYPVPVEWTLAHLNVSDDVRKNNISIGYYESGHMLYIHNPSLAKLKTDVAAFMKNAIPGN